MRYIDRREKVTTKIMKDKVYKRDDGLDNIKVYNVL
jgi:hypothetical protein